MVNIMIITIETRLKLDLTQESIIDSCVNLWSEFYRKTWVMLNNKHLCEVDIYAKLSSTNSLTSAQISSLINKVKTEHSKFKGLTKNQLKQSQSKLDKINKFIDKELKLIDKNKKEIIKLKSKENLDYTKISKLENSNKKKIFVINQKKIKVKRLIKSISILQKRIATNTFKLCFGSSKLLSQRPGSHSDKFRLTDNQKTYDSVDDWKNDWKLARNNIWISIGNKEAPQGNREIQYYTNDKKLKLRVTDKEYLNRLELISKEIGIDILELNDNRNHKYSPYRMQARFIEIENVEFCSKNQTKIVQAISNKHPITAKIVKQLTSKGDVGFYLQLSFEEIVIPQAKLSNKPKTIGVDLNEKGLAYSAVKSDGNKVKNAHGFIQWDLKNKTTDQREWIISNSITELLKISQQHGVYSIAIENLDFSSNISDMNSGYKSNQKYNKMLTQFVKSKFQEFITKKAERLAMSVSLVNPSYSSVGGYAKYGLINKLPVDIAAALWLARQSIFGKEYKKEDKVSFKKQFKEGISFPYHKQPKQSKRLFKGELKWSELSSALGKNRKHWYEKLMDYIQPTVVKSLSDKEKEFNPFELNQGQIYSKLGDVGLTA